MENNNSFCPKCGTKLNKNANFCMNCGEKIIKDEKIKCPSCEKTSPSGAKFCSNCGYAFVSEQPADNKVYLSSKITTIFFFVCAVLGTYLFTSPGFNKWFLNLDECTPLAILSFIIAIVFFFMGCKDGKLDISKEINNLTKLNLTKYLVSFTFLIAGIIILMGIGNPVASSSEYGGVALILGASFFVFLGALMISNVNKSATGLNGIAQFLVFIASLACFGGSFYLKSYGEDLNSNVGSQLESIFEKGRANPGNEYIEFSNYAIIAGIVLLVLFIILRTGKAKDNYILNLFIIVGGVLAVLLFGLFFVSTL